MTAESFDLVRKITRRRRTYRNVGQRYSRAGSGAIMDTRENASGRARVILTSTIAPPDATRRHSRYGKIRLQRCSSHNGHPTGLSACSEIFMVRSARRMCLFVFETIFGTLGHLFLFYYSRFRTSRCSFVSYFVYTLRALCEGQR